jgi:hypothetical protein
MKRNILLICLIFAGGIVMSQERSSPIKFSLIGSPQLSWLKSDVVENEKGPMYFGYYAGLEFDYFFEDNYGFSTGLNLLSTGGSLTYLEEQVIHFDAGADTMAPGTKMTFQLKYLDIPLGLKFTSSEIGYTTVFADVGLNLLINTKATATATDNNYVKEPISEEISMFNIGYHIEGGILYSFGNNLSLVIALEYRNTFLDLTNDRGAPVTDNVYINQLGLKLGLAF